VEVKTHWVDSVIEDSSIVAGKPDGGMAQGRILRRYTARRTSER
jgi:hypothetical protein